MLDERLFITLAMYSGAYVLLSFIQCVFVVYTGSSSFDAMQCTQAILLCTATLPFFARRGAVGQRVLCYKYDELGT